MAGLDQLGADKGNRIETMTDKAIIASVEMWCEQPGTRLLVQKDDNEQLHLTIRCGHIEVKATLAQFRIENLVAAATAKPKAPQ